MSDTANIELESYEDLAKKAVAWWDQEKAVLVQALSRSKKPFSTSPRGMDEYRTLATADWGKIVAERGIDKARQMAKRYFELRRRYGPSAEIPPPDLLDKHVSPHPRDPELNPNL